MNLDTALTLIQDYRNKLAVWGVGSTTLIVVGLLGVVCFAFSMREVLSWYLRTQEMRDEVRELRQEIAELKHALSQFDFARTQSAEPIAKTEPPTTQLKFRLDH